MMRDVGEHTLMARIRGAAAVEFALVLMPLILMIFGTTEIGRAIYSFNSLDKTVRDAARHLSQHGPGESIIAVEAKCLAVYGNTDCTGSPLVAGLTIGDVLICDASTCPDTHSNQTTGLGSINLVTVSIHNYGYDSLVEFVIRDLTFNDISVTLRAQL